MSDLTDFLLARIAEDEAERVIPDGDPGWPFTRRAEEVAESERWKAECEAKRRIVEDFQHLDADYKTTHAERTESRRFQALVSLARLAAVYADHLDYREEWRP